MLRDFVLNDHSIKVAVLASECGISNGNNYVIMHEHLGVSNVSTRWVPRNLNMQDRQQTRTSGSVQCQSRRHSHSSCNRRWNFASPLGSRLKKSDHEM